MKRTREQRRTLARLRLCRMLMRKQGLLVLDGYTPPKRGDCVSNTWARARARMSGAVRSHT